MKIYGHLPILGLLWVLWAPVAMAQPFNIVWYDDREESVRAGSIREYLESEGHTVDYHSDGAHLDLTEARYEDYDVVVAEHTCGGGTILGLEEWLEGGRGYVALINNSQYSDPLDSYIKGVLDVNNDGCPLVDPVFWGSHSDWVVADLEWVDPIHPIATIPNDGWSPRDIAVSQYQEHVDITGGEPVMRSSRNEAVALVVSAAILGPGTGSVAYLGTNFHDASRSDPESRYLVENMITWVVLGGDVDGDGFTIGDGDCDDRDPVINPEAREVCDDVDNDCDDHIDEGFPMTNYYPDEDGDTFGDAELREAHCAPVEGWVTRGGDCDDTDETVHTGARELCDGVDNDCDGSIDEGLPRSTYYPDDDADGFGNERISLDDCAPITGWTLRGGDCDDTAPTIHPGAAEVCDELDNDCDGRADDGLPSTTYYEDDDGDTYGWDSSARDSCAPIEGWVTRDGDCDDDCESCYPGADELCDDRDNDCDGEADEELEFTIYYRDADGDGFGLEDTGLSTCAPMTGWTTEPGDCDDACPSCFPGGVEVCDGRDNDCNDLIDDGRAIWTDADGDGFGDPATEREHCELPPGHVENGDDCDDSEAGINPDAVEVCNGLDDDCDGQADDGLVAWYHLDRDGDGYGAPDDGLETCDPPTGHVPNDSDCDDSLADVHPGAAELEDGIDNDCDGETDEGFGADGDADTDADGDADGDTDDIDRDQGGCNCMAAPGRSAAMESLWRLIW